MKSITARFISPLVLITLVLSGVTTNTHASAAGVSTTAKSQIRKLFYDERQAMAVSTASWISFVKSHNYPGAVQTDIPLWNDWESKLLNANFKISVTPDLSTVDFDPSWKWVAGNCHPAMKSKPKGTTYIVTVDQTVSSDYDPVSNAKVDIHVTIWNGRAYFYQTICFGS